MSINNSNTTADYIEWNTMLSLVRGLYRNKEFRMSLLMGAGCFLGLRISDLLRLRWSMILDNENLQLIEKKTGKMRIIKFNPNFQKHILDCFNSLRIEDKDEFCFLSQKKTVYLIQRINVILKEIKKAYDLLINHFSTHTFRKTFGRNVVENAGNNSEFALIKLSEIFNHSSTMITRRYLGLRQQEIMKVYDSLDF